VVLDCAAASVGSDDMTAKKETHRTEKRGTRRFTATPHSFALAMAYVLDHKTNGRAVAQGKLRRGNVALNVAVSDDSDDKKGTTGYGNQV
jgi:hypothetical protein